MDINDNHKRNHGLAAHHIAVSASIICTVVFKFVQIRYFTAAWRYFFAPSEQETKAGADMSPVQALMNALNSNLGNGTIAGMAIALVAGGPGAAFWILVMGLLLMAVRFAEVFLSLIMAPSFCRNQSRRPYALFVSCSRRYNISILIWFSFFSIFWLGANGVQVNAIALSFKRAFGLPAYIMGASICGMCYLCSDWRCTTYFKRIAKDSAVSRLVFFVYRHLVILIVKWAAIIPALKFIVSSAFSPLALAGGALGFTVQQALRTGITSIAFASEAGLEQQLSCLVQQTANHPSKMLSYPCSVHFLTTMMAFTLTLCIVATGVWNNGLTSTPLTMSAFSTVFGSTWQLDCHVSGVDLRSWRHCCLCLCRARSLDIFDQR